MANAELDSALPDEEANEAADAAARDHWKRLKRRCIWSMFALGIVFGAYLGTLEDRNDSTPADFLVGLGFTIATVAWFKYDSYERDYFISTNQWGLIIIFWVIGIPLYFYRTRGRRALITAACIVALIVALAVTTALAEFIVVKLYWGMDAPV